METKAGDRETKTGERTEVGSGRRRAGGGLATRPLGSILAGLAALAALLLVVAAGCGGDATGGARADAGTRSDVPAAPDAGQTTGAKQILFGDLHVHSTHSLDAMINAMPILSGGGFNGPAQRCNFARYCSQLDFWAITDHPEHYTPALWTDTKEAIRTCNALGGGGGPGVEPSMVSFLGWEWTQSADDPKTDWGHKNVIFVDTDDDKVPARPIAAPPALINVTKPLIRATIKLMIRSDPENEDTYAAMGTRTTDALDVPYCEKGIPSPDLPEGCHEVAEDPAELFDKLDQWGFDALVIPHGTAWGAHNPMLSTWANQLDAARHRPGYQRLVEVYSGHGSMEEYRPWRHATIEADGSLGCPEPSEGFLPCCWRAGAIARGRSAACKADPGSSECAAEVQAARQAYIDAGIDGPTTLDDVAPEEWLDCGQCTDCFQPAFIYRPGMTAQAALALGNFDDPNKPLRYRFGLIGSTDSHKAGPGAGYKERREASDQFGPAKKVWEPMVSATARLLFREWERQNNYWYSGGLVAVHAEGRSREAIWAALKRREVFATSGERILLWFDLLNGPGDTRIPMGAEVEMDRAPAFEVRAVGAFTQTSGCPAEIVAEAPAGFIEESCFGECYHPTDTRMVIRRIEVIKITPQISADEAIAPLIQDPWRTLDCDPDPEGCTVRFADPDFLGGARPALYYVRAIQEPTPQFNAAGLRCTRDDQGRCTEVRLCPAGYAASGDACLSSDEERAWSSPIFLNL